MQSPESQRRDSRPRKKIVDTMKYKTFLVGDLFFRLLGSRRS